MTATADNALSQNNDYIYGGFGGIIITTPDPNTGRSIPATGLLTLYAFLALNKGDVPIVNTLLPLAEYSGTPGAYTATLPSSVVNVAIAGLSSIWMAIKLPNSAPNDLLIWKKLPVVQDRDAG